MANKKKAKKSFIYTAHRKLIKQDYFNWEIIERLAKKYWYTVYAIKKYVNWSWTKTFIDENWVIRRKCSTCIPITYKLEDKYLTHSYVKWKKMLMAHCKWCHYRKLKNKKIIAKNMWDDKYLNYFRKAWNKNKVKYNFRRRFMRIIWYLDRKGRIIKKDQI